VLIDVTELHGGEEGVEKVCQSAAGFGDVFGSELVLFGRWRAAKGEPIRLGNRVALTLQFFGSRF